MIRKVFHSIAVFACVGQFQFAQAQSTSADQTEVKDLIQTLYSYDPDSFEYGEFDSKLQPFLIERVPSHGGKYSPERHCKLLRDFFEETIIKKKPISQGRIECNVGVMGYVRFPTLGDEDHSSATRFRDIPKPRIGSPIVSGRDAKVAVLTGDGKTFSVGRSLYFLTKGDQGWRIRNFMVHTRWPDLDDKLNNCYFNFAREPSPDEEKEIPKHCRQ
ncbi:hypothetical protein [Azoarcus sp. KH32C]|uniref:hypothetical protein n=1 Tax=Azoarcus sp. KH32C TaxID=748247 RepID=UPI00023861CD|nr:hypothetical protein [Azoarcus sp. KH32C]BAL26775.1 hypothetical protein AZKH_4502 [Azoarcus sp. KH32C]